MNETYELLRTMMGDTWPHVVAATRASGVMHLITGGLALAAAGVLGGVARWAYNKDYEELTTFMGFLTAVALLVALITSGTGMWYSFFPEAATIRSLMP